MSFFLSGGSVARGVFLFFFFGGSGVFFGRSGVFFFFLPMFWGLLDGPKSGQTKTGPLPG